MEGGTTDIDFVRRLVVQNGFLCQVTIVRVDGNNGKNKAVDTSNAVEPVTISTVLLIEKILLLPSVQIHELKMMIANKYGILEDEQRLYVGNIPLLRGSLLEFVTSSTIVEPSSSLLLSVPTLTIRLEHVPLTPSLRGLFQHAVSTNWKVWDEIMAKMSKERSIRKCYCDKKLQLNQIPHGTVDNLRKQTYPLMICSKCCKSNLNSYGFSLSTCEKCNFTLCQLCFDHDKGWDLPSSLYAALYDKLAMRNARCLAQLFNRTGGRRFHGHSINSEFNMDPVWKGVQMFDSSRKVLHDHVRLIIRFRDDTCQTIFNVFKDETKNGNYYTYPSIQIMLQEAERNEVLPDGATMNQLTEMLSIIYQKPIWTGTGSQLCHEYYLRTKLGSYNADEIVFELYFEEGSFWDFAE